MEGVRFEPVLLPLPSPSDVDSFSAFETLDQVGFSCLWKAQFKSRTNNLISYNLIQMYVHPFLFIIIKLWNYANSIMGAMETVY